ncbi:SLAP domain-containing protein [Lactobacillus apis]|uniref:SLAP domain-containing protein n=1 Tax=Lactobacillus apis TaxID=303541 RepID=UPI0027417A6F|nr:SLAP domain-containing protein [Lactobacillus apis]WLS84787.1 SLAP domain-containing protein [Lactobacillus apis]
MKKNLRIASAAAAALLAVAPVAASTVSTVLADTTVTVEGGTQTNPTTSAELILNVTNAATLVDGDTPAKVAASISTPSIPAGATVAPAKAQVYVLNASTATTDKLTAGTTYVVKVKVNITGLTSLAGKSITVNGSKVNVNAQGISDEIELTSASFTIPDKSLVGAPFLMEKTNSVAVTSGSVDLAANALSVKGIVDAIEGKYAVANTNGSGTGIAAVDWNVEKDVRAALKAAGITVKADGSFTKPATAFPVTLNLTATNGATSTAVITVNPAAVADTSYPVINYNGKDYNNGQTIPLKDDESFDYVPVNGDINKTALEAAFTAKVSAANTATMKPTFDYSKVNTKVAGKYPVVVSATNANKKTSKVTFMLTVGVKGASYKTVQSDGDVPVYEINGNTVTDTKTVVKNGDQIAVFGNPITVGDKTYARINSADSNKYVESKYVDGTFKPANKVAKKVMHNAYIYDKDHKRVGTKTLAAYSNVNVYGAATKLADGSLVYQIGDNQYVMADNIDGTVRTLTHNAYVYKTSTKRADRRVLRKGAKVTTYGTPYKFKNGVSYYRIGGPAKQYVKVANF